jgi:hypothetical protein
MPTPAMRSLPNELTWTEQGLRSVGSNTTVARAWCVRLAPSSLYRGYGHRSADRARGSRNGRGHRSYTHRLTLSLPCCRVHRLSTALQARHAFTSCLTLGRIQLLSCTQHEACDNAVCPGALHRRNLAVAAAQEFQQAESLAYKNREDISHS